MELSDLFRKIDCNGIQGPIEFALDLFGAVPHSNIPCAVKKIQLFTSTEFDVESLSVQDDSYVVIPLELSKEEAIKYASRCILAAAVDRNLVVYDEKCLGELSNLLLSLLRITYRSNIAKSIIPTLELTDNITDIFYDKQDKYTEDFGKLASVMKIKLHPIDMSDNINYYLNTLHGTLPPYTSKLVIAVNGNVDNFVMPYRDNHWGCGLLDNKKVILGAY